MRALSLRAIASVTSFSFVPPLPRAPGILAAVPGIHRDDDEASRVGRPDRRGRRGVRDRNRRRLGLRDGGRRLGRGGGFLALRLELLEECEQRIGRNEGIEIEDQPVAVVADRREREELRLHLALQIEHEAHDIGLEAADAHAFDVRIVRADLVREPGQGRGDIDALQVEHQAFGILQREQRVLDGDRGLQRDAGVVGSRPHARGGDLCSRLRRAGQHQQGIDESKQENEKSEVALRQGRRASAYSRVRLL